MNAACRACREIIWGPNASATTPDGVPIIGNIEAERAVKVAEAQALQIEMTKHMQHRHPEILNSVMQMAQQFGYAMVSKVFETPDAPIADPSFLTQAAPPADFQALVDQQLNMLYWTLKSHLQITKGPDLAAASQKARMNGH